LRRARRKGLRFAIALCAAGLAGAVPAARGDTDLSQFVLSGELESGGKTITGDWGSSEFREYRDQQPGYFGRSALLLEEPKSRFFLGFDYDYVGRQDQRYEGRVGQWGRWNIDLAFDEYPYSYGNNARSLYLSQGSDTLVLPAAVQTQLQSLTGAARATALGTALDAATFRELDAMYRTGRADVRIQLSPELEAKVGYFLQNRNGDRPFGMAFGSPGGNFADYVGGIDDRTQNLTAGLSYVRDTWSLAFDTFGSFYHDGFDDFTVANPLRAVDSPTAGAESGRVSRAPDNRAYALSLTGSWKLPVPAPTRVSSTVSFGQHTQDEKFLQQTINQAILAANGPALALPKDSLGGQVDTWLGTFLLTSRPLRDLDLRLRYRYYGYDNRTDTTELTANVVNDATFDSEVLFTAPNSYRTQNLSADATYRLLAPLSATLGYAYEQWNRSDERERIYTRSQTGKAALDWKPVDRVQLRAHYAVSGRTGSDYRPYAPLDQRLEPTEVPDAIRVGQLADLRKYDEADLWRNEAGVLGQLLITEGLDATLTFDFQNDSYDASRYGLKSWQQWSLGGDLGYHPCERVGITAGYTFERNVAEQLQRLRNVQTVGGVSSAIDDPLNDWGSQWRMRAHDVHAGLDVVLLPKWLDARVGYGFQLSHDQTRTNGQNGGPFLVPLDYPTDDDKLQYVTAALDFHATESLTLRAAWRWEHFDITDFRHDGTQPFMPLSNDNSQTGAVSPTSNVFLGDSIEDYNVHIVGLSAIYRF